MREHWPAVDAGGHRVALRSQVRQNVSMVCAHGTNHKVPEISALRTNGTRQAGSWALSFLHKFYAELHQNVYDGHLGNRRDIIPVDNHVFRHFAYFSHR
jgi:hypothetical protein